MSPSLKIVCHLCCISLTMLLPQLSLRYFFPFTFIYPRLSSILASFTVQIFPGAMGQALGWALREMRHRLCPSGSSRQAEKLSWKRRSRTPWSGARQEAGQRPRGAQRWEGWSLSTECSGRKASLRREPFLNVTIISAELKIRLHLPLFVNGSFESFLPSFPHFAGGAVRPTIRGLGWIYEGRIGRTEYSPPHPKRNFRAKLGPSLLQLLPHPWLIPDLCVGLPSHSGLVPCPPWSVSSSHLSPGPDPIISSCIRENKCRKGQVQPSIVASVPNRTGPPSSPELLSRVKNPGTPRLFPSRFFQPLMSRLVSVTVSTQIMLIPLLKSNQHL